MTPTPTEQVRSPRPLRRLLAVVFSLALLGGLTTACSSDNSDDSSSGNSNSDDSYYPHTMAMENGDVTINKKPERVIALGASSTATLLDLEITPIATSIDPITVDTQSPWLPEMVKEISDGSLRSNGELQYERIAELSPDLIVGSSSQFRDKDTFEKLNAIAPTVSANTGAKIPDWDEQLLAVAESLNEIELAERLISETKSKFQEVGSHVANISEVSYTFVGYTSSDDGFKYGNGSIFELFGMTPSVNQDNGGQGSISMENVSQLDSDMLFVWPYPDDRKEELENNTAFKSLDVVKRGDVHFMSYAEAAAINDTDPMALDWLLDKLTPSIEALGR